MKYKYSKRKFKAGDLIYFPDMEWKNIFQQTMKDRVWVILPIIQEDIDKGEVDTIKPGLMAFGGLWYGNKTRGRFDTHKAYGKMTDPYYRKRKYCIVGNIYNGKPQTGPDIVPWTYRNLQRLV